MPRVPTCIIWFLSGAALLSLLSFLKLFIATKPSWYEDSEIMVDDLPSLLRMIYFPSSLLPGPNYYSNNSRRQPPLPLAHWHTVRYHTAVGHRLHPASLGSRGATETMLCRATLSSLGLLLQHCPASPKGPSSWLWHSPARNLHLAPAGSTSSLAHRRCPEHGETKQKCSTY